MKILVVKNIMNLIDHLARKTLILQASIKNLVI